MANIESKVSEVITRGALVRKTEAGEHLFKIDNVNLNELDKLPTRMRGIILHKNGSKCGDFTINNFGRKMLSVNIDMNCRTLLTDLLAMLDELEANNITPVEEFTYVKEAIEVANATKS